MGFFSNVFGSGNREKNTLPHYSSSAEVLRGIDQCNMKRFTQAFIDFGKIGQAEAKASGKEFFVRKEFASFRISVRHLASV